MYLVMWKVKCVGLSGEDYLKLIITNHMIRWKQEAAHKEAPKVREDKAREMRGRGRNPASFFNADKYDRW